MRGESRIFSQHPVKFRGRPHASAVRRRGPCRGFAQARDARPGTDVAAGHM